MLTGGRENVNEHVGGRHTDITDDEACLDEAVLLK